MTSEARPCRSRRCGAEATAPGHGFGHRWPGAHGERSVAGSARGRPATQGADDFPITVADNRALTGFGDAVCVPVIEWIGRNRLTLVPDGLAGWADRRFAVGDAA